MGVLYITEFAGQGYTGPLSSVAGQPPTVEQTLSVSGVSAQSAAFNNATRMVRLHTDAATGICSILFGLNPTATTSNMRMAANQTEYFSVPVGKAFKVAAITNT